MLNVLLITRVPTSWEINNDFDKRRREIVNNILQNENCKISMLVTHPNTDRGYYSNNPRIEKVVSGLDVEYYESMKGIDYAEIDKVRDIQVYIENYYYRMEHDYQLDKYYYYTGVSYWMEFFRNNKIDVVFNVQFRDGASWAIPSEVAECKGIDVYYIEPEGYNDTYCITKKKELHAIIDSGITDIDYILKSDFDKRTTPDNKSLKFGWRKIAYSIGGNLLEDFIGRFIHWNWSARSVSRKRYKAFWSEKFVGYLKLQNIKMYLDKISQEPVRNEKYIFYALHFEPEASILARHILESQLVVLKMISECLPQGWKLYVKEHPCQFDVNKDGAYHHLYQAYRFKTKKFYKKILSFDNVKIINRKYDTDLLINNAEAVSSICGTVLWEAAQRKKNTMIFSAVHPLAHAHDAFCISSYEECINAITEIQNGFVSKYDDVDDILKKYVIKGNNMSAEIAKIVADKINTHNR